jgi:hypothetical protein
MKKIIAALDGLKFSGSTRDYAIQLARQNNAHLVGVFLDDHTSFSSAYHYEEPEPERRQRPSACHQRLSHQLKAEIEVRNLHQKIDLLMSEQMQTLFEIQKAQMELMEEIKGALKKAG